MNFTIDLYKNLPFVGVFLFGLVIGFLLAVGVNYDVTVSVVDKLPVTSNILEGGCTDFSKLENVRVQNPDCKKAFAQFIESCFKSCAFFYLYLKT